MGLIENINNYCQSMAEEFGMISEERKAELLKLTKYLSVIFKSDLTPKLIVICTHNSRRSHMGQMWLAVAADYYDLPLIRTYSGGTEATTFNKNAVDAFRRIGFEITIDATEEDNPNYYFRWNSDKEAYTAFSKRYDDMPNPIEDFGAIMVCTDADENCPIVLGAEFRLALPYEDPKLFDNTELESIKYDERCRQIGREMMWVMSQIER